MRQSPGRGGRARMGRHMGARAGGGGGRQAHVDDDEEE